MKICNLCKIEKTLLEFSIKKNNKNKELRAACDSCSIKIKSINDRQRDKRLVQQQKNRPEQYPIIPTSKFCKVCQEEKLFESFHVATKGKYGYSAICKCCSRKCDAAWRDNNRDKYKEILKRWKDNNPGRGVANHRKWGQKNPDKIKAYSKKWTDKNKEYVSAKGKRWRQNNKERHNNLISQWRLNNLDRDRTNNLKWREENKEHIRIRNKFWRQNNKDKTLQHSRNRRARKALAGGFATVEQIKARVAFYGGLCYICQAPYQCIDHVIPIKLGGSGWPGNLRPACKFCNDSKGSKPLSVFLEARRAKNLL